jgi:O-antigen/teichoic acid export membrane protein
MTLLPMTCSVVLTAMLKHNGHVRIADVVALLSNLSFVAIIAWLSSDLSVLAFGPNAIMVISLLVSVGALIVLVALVSKLGVVRRPESLNGLTASKELARRGAPVLGSNLLGGLYFLAVGRVVATAGGDSSVAALGLLMRAEQIVLVGVSVVSMTAMPLVSRYWSKTEERMKAIWSGFVLTSVWGIVAAVLSIVIVFFSSSFSVVLDFGVYYLAISPLIFVSLGALALCSSVLVVAGNEQIQFWIAVIRVLPFGILPLLLVAEHFDVALALGWYGLANLLVTPIAIRYVHQLRTSS